MAERFKAAQDVRRGTLRGGTVLYKRLPVATQAGRL